MRDFRKGLEARDERINGSLDGLRADVTNLSTALVHSQDRVEGIEKSVEKLGGDVHAIRTDVDGIINARNEDEKAWSGPKEMARNIILVGSTVAAIGGIVVFFGPAILAFL
jgi:hypothetical protein